MYCLESFTFSNLIYSFCEVKFVPVVLIVKFFGRFSLLFSAMEEDEDDPDLLVFSSWKGLQLPIILASLDFCFIFSFHISFDVVVLLIWLVVSSECVTIFTFIFDWFSG